MFETIRTLSGLLPGSGVRRAKENAHRTSTILPGEHWAVEHFPSPAEAWLPGSRVCPLGSRTRAEHIQRVAEGGSDVTWTIPFSDEYSEWTDILEAVLAAGEVFTFVDIGAGYGRWSSRAAAAARIKGKAFRLAVAEADPRNIKWLREHLADNDIGDYRLVEGAIGLERGKALLAVGRPPAEETPEIWFGQRIGWGEIPGMPVVGEHHGKPLLEANGWKFIDAEVLPLSEVIGDFEFIDLIDFDIQGAEADAVYGSIDVLNATTRRMHIETHNPDVEARIRRTLSSNRWHCLRDHPALQENETPFGTFYMEGGVQTWVNSRLI